MATDQLSETQPQGDQQKPPQVHFWSGPLGMCSYVFGMLATLGCLLAGFGTVLGIIGLTLGIIQRRRIRRGESSNPAWATAGIVLSAIGFVVSTGMFIAMVITHTPLSEMWNVRLN